MSRSRTDSERLNGTQSPPIAEKPLASMTLSSDPVVNSTDLVNVTKVFSTVAKLQNQKKKNVESNIA